MQGLVSQSKGIGEKQTSAPGWSGAFLGEIYQKVAVRYVLVAEELMRGPGRDDRPAGSLGWYDSCPRTRPFFREAGRRKQKTKCCKVAAPQNLALEARENNRSHNRSRGKA
jgi:hypothetical protein